MEIKKLELSNDLTCLASLDPDLRVFDIIMNTEFGTSYNSYILKGNEKTALFETSKMPFWDDYLQALKDNVDLNKIDYIICDHTEPDHAGILSLLIENCPNATIVGSAAAIMFIKAMANKPLKTMVVKDGDQIDLGNKTLKFISAPFLHWPDSIFTYVPEEKVIFTCDVFGCHFADSRMKLSLIDDRIKDYEKALAYYYFVIMSPFKDYVLEALDSIKNLDIDTVCVGHGPVLDCKFDEIKEKYKNWSQPNKNESGKFKVFMGFISAYGYTSQIGDKLKKYLEDTGKIEVGKYDVSEEDHGKMNSLINKSDGVLIGSCTINSDAVKPVYDLLSHTSVPINKDKPAAAFGSYGWSGEGPTNLTHRLNDLQFKIVNPGLKINFLPSKDEEILIKQFAEDFAAALFEKAQNKHERVGTKKWRCIVCGEVYEGDLPPDICPACGVGSDKFEEVIVEDVTFSSDKEDNIVIIGSGIAAISACEAIRLRNQKCKINIYTDEKILPYYRTKLSEMIFEDIADKNFILKNKDWFKDYNINIHLNAPVTNVDPDKKTITIKSNEKVNYGKLILANGSYCVVPAIEGSKKEGIFSIRDYEDLNEVKEYLKNIKKCVVIGGGLLGLEAAWNIKQCKKDVSIIELAERLLPFQLNEEGSYIFEKIVNEKNIEIVKGLYVRRILGDDKVSAVQLEDGTEIKCDMVIFATGICPNVKIVENRGFKINRGVVVNEKMETGVKDVWACGDLAEFNGIVYGNWDASKNMGKIAGANACGDDKDYVPQVKAYVLNSMGTEVFSTGELGLKEKDYKAYMNKDYKKNLYKKSLFRNNMMCGAMLIGDTKKSLRYLKGIKDNISSEKFLKSDLL